MFSFLWEHHEEDASSAPRRYLHPNQTHMA